MGVHYACMSKDCVFSCQLRNKNEGNYSNALFRECFSIAKWKAGLRWSYFQNGHFVILSTSQKNNVTACVICRNFNISKSSLPTNRISSFPSRSLSFMEVFLGTEGRGWEPVCYTFYSNKCSFTKSVVETDGVHCDVFICVYMLHFAHIHLITTPSHLSFTLTSPCSGFMSCFWIYVYIHLYINLESS